MAGEVCCGPSEIIQVVQQLLGAGEGAVFFVVFHAVKTAVDHAHALVAAEFFPVTVDEMPVE